VTQDSTPSVTIEWPTPNDEELNGATLGDFIVQYCGPLTDLDTCTYSTLATLSSTTLTATYTDSDLTACEPYYLRVKARDDAELEIIETDSTLMYIYSYTCLTADITEIETLESTITSYEDEVADLED
jgi:hypothetical protein